MGEIGEIGYLRYLLYGYFHFWLVGGGCQSAFRKNWVRYQSEVHKC
jgi:hypothetical protein